MDAWRGTRLTVWLVLVIVGAAAWGYAQAIQTFDIVLQGGRVIDPETGLDAVRNVGIRGNQIVEISDRPLQGRDVVDVSGLVVAPGFIDLHAHGQTNEANEFQAHDGVTTALELESGEGFLRQWLDSRAGHAVLNYGASIGHRSLRWRAMERYGQQADQATQIVRDEGLELDPEQPLHLACFDESRRVRDVVIRPFPRELADGIYGGGSRTEAERAKALPHVVASQKSNLRRKI